MIRLVLITLFFMSSLLAQAADRNSSWGQIMGDRSLKIQAPSVSLAHAYGTTVVSVFSVCRKGAQIELIGQVLDVCTRTVLRGRAGNVCVSYDRVKPVASVIATKNVCVKRNLTRGGVGPCRRWETQVTNYAQPMLVRVVDASGSYSRFRGLPERFRFEKSFTIPACSAIR